MPEWLDNNDILTHSNEGKSVAARKLIKTLKAKNYKQMTANARKSYLPCLDKLVDQYSNTDHQY